MVKIIFDPLASFGP